MRVCNEVLVVEVLIREVLFVVCEELVHFQTLVEVSLSLLPIIDPYETTNILLVLIHPVLVQTGHH